MKRSILVLFVLAAISIPAQAHADPTLCTDLRDVVGDPHGVGNAEGFVPAEDARAIDLTEVALGVTGNALHIRVTVVDLSASAGPPADTATYTATWTDEAGAFTRADATRSAGRGWSFTFQGPDGSSDVTGSVAVPRGTIEIAVPTSLPHVGGPMRDLGVQSQQARSVHGVSGTTVALREDGVGNTLDGIVTDPAAPCAAPLDPVATMCALARDATGDETASTFQAPDAAQDILLVSMGTSSNALIVETRVADVSGDLPPGVLEQRWNVSWREAEAFAAATVIQNRNGVSFTYAEASSETATDGTFDPVAGVMRVVVPLTELRRPGTSLSQISALSSVRRYPYYDEGSDFAPDSDQAALTYAVGGSCGAAVAACPIVVDTARDEDFPVLYGYPEPHRSAASDLRAIGAETTPAALAWQIRVTDAFATPQVGASSVGWTVTWARGTARYFAQAERAGSRMRYTVGIADDGTGPFFDGDKTKGSISDESVIHVAAPRDAVGDPADGDALSDVQAIAWHITGTGGTAAGYSIDDTTSTGTFSVGAQCSL